MGKDRAIATRMTVVAAAILAFLMIGVPGWNVDNATGPVDNAAASGPGDRTLRVGWIEMQAAIGTLNPLLYTMAEEMMVIWPCYSNLLTRDVEGQIIGDLASSYSVSADGKTWHFNLVRTAKFYDMLNPLVDHPVTGRDVRFTYLMVQNETGSSMNSYIPKVGGAPLIDNIYYGVDLYDLYIHTTTAYGPLTSALTSIPILPQYLWSTKAWNWDNFDSRAGIAPVIGSGPFYYGLTGMPSTGVVDLVRSPVWYGTIEYGWQLHTNRVTFKSEASQDSNLVDYQNGVIDIMMEVTPTQFTSPSLPGEKFAASTGFVYEYNLNQMTDARRATNPTWSRGTSNQLLLDPVVKEAIAMSVNKNQFVSDVLNGLGSYADSLIPDISPWHYWYGLQPGEDPERVGRAPVGEEPIPYDLAGARALLNANGWNYDSSGALNPSATPLCKAGGTSKLQFRFWTMDSDPQWNAGAQLLAQAAWQIGVDITTLYEVKNSAFMNSAWKTADYDMWLWDWMFSPTSEPSADIMEVLTSTSTWGDVFWSDPVYDALYAQSLVTADPVARMVILDEMQRIAYENLGCQLVAYRKELYAASNLGPDHWQNYGNWNTKFTLMPDQLYPWLYVQIEPNDNPAPKIQVLKSQFNGTTTTPVSFSATVTDTNAMHYKWIYGDGTNSGWLTNPVIDKQYAKDGLYRAWLVVQETDGSDYFMVSKSTVVRVIDVANSAPSNVGFTYTPLDPDSGTIVTLSGSATDANPGDTLTYAWDFGDGTSVSGQVVTHQFTKGSPSYNVKLMVDDGHLGQAPRPVNATKSIAVKINTAPTCSVPDVANVIKTTPHVFSITTSDPDTRDSHRYTWDWGDGSAKTVTTLPGATHTYSLAKAYVMTVYADDLTGLAGHNVSDTGNVQVKTGTPHPPTAGVVIASTVTPGRGNVVTFTASATDPDGDVCLMTFDFGDGATAQTFQTTANSSVSVTHAYMTVDLFAVYVTAFDGSGSDMSNDPLAIDVQPTFQLNLVAGWNFVSVAWTGFGYKASNMGLDPGSVVCSWDPATVKYDKTYTVGSSPPFKDFSIMGSTGYWVYSPVGQTLYLGGTVPSTPQSRSITVPAGGGWAIVAFNSMSTTKKASNIPAMYTGGTVQIVASYNAVAKTYATWTPGSPPFKDFYLVPGAAYWVYLSASGTLTYSP